MPSTVPGAPASVQIRSLSDRNRAELEAEAVRLYVEERLSARLVAARLADRFGCEPPSDTWVYKRLRRAGVARRREWISRAVRAAVRRDHAEAATSLSAIARRHGISLASVYRILAGQHHPRRAPRYSAAMAREAVRLYVERGLAPRRLARRLARHYGCKAPSTAWVYEQLRRYGVPARSRSEAQALSVCQRVGGSSAAGLRRRAKWLRQVGRMTQERIAAELGVTQEAVSLWLRAEGLTGRLPRHKETA